MSIMIDARADCVDDAADGGGGSGTGLRNNRYRRDIAFPGDTAP
jgi:hypothetical protein